MQRTTRQLLEHMRLQLDGKSSHVPAGGQLIWRWFIDLCRTRSYHGYGPNPLTYAEIEAYARVYGWPIDGRHVDAILEMDRAWLARARSGSDGSAAHSQPMTAEAFDAVFA